MDPVIALQFVTFADFLERKPVLRNHDNEKPEFCQGIFIDLRFQHVGRSTVKVLQLRKCKKGPASNDY